MYGFQSLFRAYGKYDLLLNSFAYIKMVKKWYLKSYATKIVINYIVLWMFGAFLSLFILDILFFVLD